MLQVDGVPIANITAVEVATNRRLQSEKITVDFEIYAWSLDQSAAVKELPNTPQFSIELQKKLKKAYGLTRTPEVDALTIGL